METIKILAFALPYLLGETTKFFAFLSSSLLVASIIPYLIRVKQKKMTPQIISWFLWTLIGTALLLTYKDSGAGDNVWSAVLGAINPALVFALIIWQRNDIGKIAGWDWGCLVFGLLALLLWYNLLDKGSTTYLLLCYFLEEENLMQYALYVGIIADLFAAIPTIKAVWVDPVCERPFMWGCYAFGYGLGMLAITDHTISNYSLPLYMFLGGSSITLPLIMYRIKNNVPLNEWI